MNGAGERHWTKLTSKLDACPPTPQLLVMGGVTPFASKRNKDTILKEVLLFPPAPVIYSFPPHPKFPEFIPAETRGVIISLEEDMQAGGH